MRQSVVSESAETRRKKAWRVAILVAIYRAGRFIQQKLQTLADQTAFDDCLIVLLNCQNLDDEKSAYHEFMGQHENVISIEYSEHRRLYSTWNDGIAATASGRLRTDYLMTSNADDMLKPDCVEKLIAALDTNQEYGVVMGDSYVTDVPNQKWPDWSYHGLINTMYPLGTAGPCPMWRRSMHEEHGPFGDYRTIGDARQWEKWHAAGVKFLNVPGALSLYYHCPGHNLELRIDEATGRSLRDLDLDQDIADSHPAVRSRRVAGTKLTDTKLANSRPGDHS